MSNQFSSDEEVLARLVREAGDPSVSPDPQYAETLRATILDRVGPAETVAHRTGTVREADVSPIITVERTRQMKRIAKLAVAATILMAIGILVFWMTIGGGSTNIALANVADALDSLRSATYDATMEMKDPMNRTTTTINTTGMFLAPSSERIEMSSPEGHGVMNNFRYDIELDPSLFSLEPPVGYTFQKKAVTMPVEEDLVNILRLIAEHNDGTLPPTIGANKEYIQAVQTETKLETEKLIKTPEAQKLMEKLKAQYARISRGS